MLFGKTWEDVTQFASHESYHKQVVSFSKSNTIKIKCHSEIPSFLRLSLRPYYLLATQAMYSEGRHRIIKPFRLEKTCKIIHSSHYVVTWLHGCSLVFCAEEHQTEGSPLAQPLVLGKLEVGHGLWPPHYYCKAAKNTRDKSFVHNHFRHHYSSEWREALVYVGLSHMVPLLLSLCMPQCVQPVTQTSEKQLGNIQVPEVRKGQWQLWKERKWGVRWYSAWAW